MRHICKELNTNLCKTYTINLHGWEVHSCHATNFSFWNYVGHLLCGSIAWHSCKRPCIILWRISGKRSLLWRAILHLTSIEDFNNLLYNITSKKHIRKEINNWKKSNDKKNNMYSTWGLPLMLVDWFDDWLELFVF